MSDEDNNNPDTPVVIDVTPSRANLPRESWMCTAHLRNGSGDLCRKPRLPGQLVCGSHGGRAPQNLAKAKRRILEAIDPVVAQLIDVAMQPSGLCSECGRTADALKLRAMMAVMDRGFDSTSEPDDLEHVKQTKTPDCLYAMTTEELETILDIYQKATARLHSGAHLSNEQLEQMIAEAP